MPESDNHRYLVEQIQRWVRANEPAASEYLVVDLDGHLGKERPPEIDGYRPDAYASGGAGRLTIVGEAKTELDLDSSHSRSQLASYIAYLATQERGTIVLSTQWQAIRTGRSLLKRLAKSAGATSVTTVVISDIERFAVSTDKGGSE